MKKQTLILIAMALLITLTSTASNGILGLLLGLMAINAWIIQSAEWVDENDFPIPDGVEMISQSIPETPLV